MIRTHDAGTLRAEHVGQTVTLAGWVANRRDHGGVAFLDLREASGVVQVVVRDEAVAHGAARRVLPAGHRRGDRAQEGNENPNLATGAIEVIATDVEVLNAAAPLPFPIDEHVDVGEEARLSTATSTCAAAAPAARSGCAARSTRPPATCSTPATSSRSRPRP